MVWMITIIGKIWELETTILSGRITWISLRLHVFDTWHCDGVRFGPRGGLRWFSFFKVFLFKNSRITLIAFGASVPDALSSLLVAKNGKFELEWRQMEEMFKQSLWFVTGQGDMAVSNAIGSNVFDILICLGIPWLVRCLTIDKADHINVKSKGKYNFNKHLANLSQL